MKDIRIDGVTLDGANDEAEMKANDLPYRP